MLRSVCMYVCVYIYMCVCMFILLRVDLVRYLAKGDGEDLP